MGTGSWLVAEMHRSRTTFERQSSGCGEGPEVDIPTRERCVSERMQSAKQTLNVQHDERKRRRADAEGMAQWGESIAGV